MLLDKLLLTQVLNNSVLFPPVPVKKASSQADNLSEGSSVKAFGPPFSSTIVLVGREKAGALSIPTPNSHANTPKALSGFWNPLK